MLVHCLKTSELCTVGSRCDNKAPKPPCAQAVLPCKSHILGSIRLARSWALLIWMFWLRSMACEVAVTWHWCFACSNLYILGVHLNSGWQRNNIIIVRLLTCFLLLWPLTCFLADSLQIFHQFFFEKRLAAVLLNRIHICMQVVFQFICMTRFIEFNIHTLGFIWHYLHLAKLTYLYFF